ncbi:spinster family MFS transporter [Sphingopyxis sp. 550A]|jgi:MFS family permease
MSDIADQREQASPEQFGISPKMTGYALGVLALVSFFNYADRMVLSVIAEPLKRELGLSDANVGLLSGLIFALVYAAAGIPIARLADRTVRVRILGLCVAIWSVATAMMGFAGSFLSLAVARMGVAIGEAGCIPISHSVIGDYMSPRRRALGISLFQAGGIAGLSIGLIIAAYLTGQFGWRMTLLAFGLCGLPLALLILLTLPEPAPREARSEAGEPWHTAFVALMKRAPYRHIVAANTFGAFASYSLKLWMIPYFIRSHHLSVAEAGAWMGAASAAGGIFGVLLGGGLSVRLIQKDARWEMRLPMITSIASAPLYGLVLLSPDVPTALSMQVFASMAAGGASGVALSSIQSFCEPHRRAMGIAIMVFAIAIFGNGLGPFISGAISDIITPRFGEDALRWALLVPCAAFLAAAVMFFLAARSVSGPGSSIPSDT